MNVGQAVLQPRAVLLSFGDLFLLFVEVSPQIRIVNDPKGQQDREQQQHDQADNTQEEHDIVEHFDIGVKAIRIVRTTRRVLGNGQYVDH